MKLSVIIPCFNEVHTIREVIQRVRAVAIGMEREIIVVDDGSTDGTRELLTRLQQDLPSDPHATQIHHYSLINMGKGAAVRIGLQYASGDICLIQDADMELDPAEYPRLLRPLVQGEADVVFGTRNFWQGSRKRTILANIVLSLLTSCLYQTRISDMETAYKVMRRNVIRRIRLCANGFEIEPEITAKILRLGYRICEVPLRYYQPRTTLQGKKIGFYDGLKAIYYLLKYRLVPKRSFLLDTSEEP